MTNSLNVTHMGEAYWLLTNYTLNHINKGVLKMRILTGSADDSTIIALPDDSEIEIILTELSGNRFELRHYMNQVKKIICWIFEKSQNLVSLY